MTKYVIAVLCVLALASYGNASPTDKSAGKVVNSAVAERAAALKAIES